MLARGAAASHPQQRLASICERRNQYAYRNQGRWGIFAVTSGLVIHGMSVALQVAGPYSEIRRVDADKPCPAADSPAGPHKRGLFQATNACSYMQIGFPRPIQPCGVPGGVRGERQTRSGHGQSLVSRRSILGIPLLTALAVKSGGAEPATRGAPYIPRPPQHLRCPRLSTVRFSRLRIH